MNKWAARILGALLVAFLLLVLYGMQRTLERMVRARQSSSQSP
ncbi:MAG: hypothetical protein ABI718_02160 [Acidobacteriota bacterium]